jgi:PAS domain S-box-containing protein
MQQILIDFAYNRWPAVLLALVPALLNIGLLFYIQFFMPRRRINTIFSIFIIALILWQTLDMLMRLSRTEETSRMWDAVLCIGWISVGPLGLHFTLTYTGRKKFISTSGGLALLYLPVLLASAVYTVKIDERHFFFNQSLGWISAHNETMLDRVLSYSLAVYAVVFCALLYAYAFRLRKNRLKSSQAMLMASGMAIPIIQGLITQIVLPAFHRELALPITSTFMCFFSGAAVIALSRGNLYDVNEYLEPGMLINRLKQIIFTISPDGSVQYMNKEGLAVLGIKNRYFQDYHYHRLFASDTDFKKLDDNCIDQCAYGAAVEHYPARIVGKDLKIFDVLLSATPIISNGILEGIMLVAHDVTELRTTEKEKEANLAIFSNMVSYMQAGVLIEDENRRIFTVNQEFCGILGFGEGVDELVGESFPEQAENLKFNFSKPTEFISRMNELIARGRPCKFEELTLMDGRFLERDYSPIHSADGRFIGHLWIYRDITARKRSEEEMLLKNLELEKVNNELDRFVYSASHDIRAPLRSIIGLVNISEKEKNLADVRQNLAMIRRSVVKLDKFTLNLVHFSRNTKLEVANELIDISQLLQIAVRNAIEGTGVEHVTVTTKIEQLAELYSDNDRLKTVIQNLVTNALAFHDSYKQHPSVSIFVKVNFDSAIIEVQDNGIGISAEHHQRIFEMFFRASQLTMGSGLGLYISREIVHKLKGTIKVYSSLGEGSRFLLSVPNNKMTLAAAEAESGYMAK